MIHVGGVVPVFGKGFQEVASDIEAGQALAANRFYQAYRLKISGIENYRAAKSARANQQAANAQAATEKTAVAARDAVRNSAIDQLENGAQYKTPETLKAVLITVLKLMNAHPEAFTPEILTTAQKDLNYQTPETLKGCFQTITTMVRSQLGK